MKFGPCLSLLFFFTIQPEVYCQSHPDIPFEAAMKSARQCLGESQAQFYCVGMHWFGLTEYPGKGYWAMNFWNSAKEFRSVYVFPNGSAQWHNPQERRSWEYIPQMSLSLEDAVVIAQNYAEPEKRLFLSGAGIDSALSNCIRVTFYGSGDKDYTSVYVTLDGKIHHDPNQIPIKPNFRADQFLVPPKVTVTAYAAFDRVSIRDTGMEIHFNYKYPTPYLVDPPNTYQCSYDSMTYLVTAPDGKQYSLNLVDKKKDAGYFTAASFNLIDDKIFDAIGEWPGLSNERRFFWLQTDVPTFKMPGEYHVVQTGTFHDTTGQLPDIPYQSTEAICVVDPKVLSQTELKAKAQTSLQTIIGRPIPEINWAVREELSGDRTVHGLVSPEIIPESQVPVELRKKGDYPVDAIAFGADFGVCEDFYGFGATPLNTPFPPDGGCSGQ